MLEKIMKCGLVGGVILFIWGAVAWTILPWQKSQIKSFSNEIAVRNAIGNNMQGSGLYVLPNLHEYAHQPAELEAAKVRMEQGPFATVAVMANGRNPNMAGHAIASLVLNIIAACFGSWLLMKSGQLEFMKAIKFLSVVGVIAGLLSSMPMVIWFGFPLSFGIGCLIESVLGWFFAALGITRVLKLRKKA